MDDVEFRGLIERSCAELQNMTAYAPLLERLQNLQRSLDAGSLGVQDLQAIEGVYFRYPELTPTRGIRKVTERLDMTRALLIEIRNHRVQLEQPRPGPPSAPAPAPRQRPSA